MKNAIRILVLALILALALASAGMAETFYARQVDFCNEYVTLRAKPSSSAKALDYVYLGDVVMAAPLRLLEQNLRSLLARQEC